MRQSTQLVEGLRLRTYICLVSSCRDLMAGEHISIVRTFTSVTHYLHHFPPLSMVPYPSAPTVNILLGCLVLLLLPWKLQSRALNVSICSYIIWISVICFCISINEIVWRGSTEDVAPIWCEIGMFLDTLAFFDTSYRSKMHGEAIRLMMDSAIAFPACELAIIRRLYFITCRCTPGTRVSPYHVSFPSYHQLRLWHTVRVFSCPCRSCYMLRATAFGDPFV